MQWNKLTVVGVGLLGGSLGLVAKRHGLAKVVAGYVRRAASVRECRKLGVVDWASLELAKAVAGADLVVLCTPVAQMRPLMERMLPLLKPGAIVTDVGSVKGSVVDEVEALLAKTGVHFVGSHPMAGSEKLGAAAARADLFENSICVVTASGRSNRAAVRRVEQLWKEAGAQVLRMSPAEHDLLVSRSSHLPHVVAAGLVNVVLAPRHPRYQGLLCANGFRDTTRVASGSPEMWRDIALANRKNLDEALQSLMEQLKLLRRCLHRGDSQGVMTFFEQAKSRRDGWLEAHCESGRGKRTGSVCI